VVSLFLRSCEVVRVSVRFVLDHVLCRTSRIHITLILVDNADHLLEFRGLHYSPLHLRRKSLQFPVVQDLFRSHVEFSTTSNFSDVDFECDFAPSPSATVPFPKYQLVFLFIFPPLSPRTIFGKIRVAPKFLKKSFHHIADFSNSTT
jgi:hypothetical protein